jgi:small subunit ribosomal protein S16
MSVKIRLRRIGRKKQPSYRLVVTNVENPRGGEYLDTLGFYNPRSKPAELRLDLEKVDKWLADGAELSDTAASLVRKARRGGDATVTMRPVGGESAKAAPPAPIKARKKAAAPAPAAAPSADAGEAPAEA